MLKLITDPDAVRADREAFHAIGCSGLRTEYDRHFPDVSDVLFTRNGREERITIRQLEIQARDCEGRDNSEARAYRHLLRTAYAQLLPKLVK